MPRISEETIQRVAEATDIVEIVGGHVPLKRVGATFRGLCPFHKEKTPSFYVNPQRQSFHCFGCGAGGSVFKFLMDYEHLDFVSAVRRLAQKAGIAIIEEAGGPENDDRRELRQRLLALHVEATMWFQQQLLKTPEAQKARDYLKSRGITAEVAKSWQLGYAPDSWDAVMVHLREKKFSPEEILQSGLVSVKEEDNPSDGPGRQYSRFRDRVMFPICNDYGEVVAFSGRVLDPEARTAKYVNSPETPLFTKGRVLYGLHKSKRALIDASTAIVCEGQLDLISAFESGVENVIAPQGTAFTADQARLLGRFVKTVVLCFDSDRAGQEAVNRSLPSLLERDLEVRVCRLPAGEDPDSLIRSQGAEAFQKTVNEARNFFQYATDRLAETGSLEDATRISAAMKRLAPLVALINDKVVREHTTSQICARLGVPINEFKSHMQAPAPASATHEEPRREDVKPTVLAEGIRQLCRLSFLNAEVRAWLSQQTQPRLEELGDGGALLARIVASPLPLEESASRAIFVTALPASDELVINTLDLDRPPEDGEQALSIAENSWLGLAFATWRNQQEIATNRLRQAGLPAEERTRLQHSVIEINKQILDLQSRLKEV